jgi:hypothetical protein
MLENRIKVEEGKCEINRFKKVQIEITMLELDKQMC